MKKFILGVCAFFASVLLTIILATYLGGSNTQYGTVLAAIWLSILYLATIILMTSNKKA